MGIVAIERRICMLPLRFGRLHLRLLGGLSRSLVSVLRLDLPLLVGFGLLGISFIEMLGLLARRCW